MLNILPKSSHARKKPPPSKKKKKSLSNLTYDVIWHAMFRSFVKNDAIWKVTPWVVVKCK